MPEDKPVVRDVKRGREKMHIALRDRTLDLKEGERVVIPKGMDHKPVCPEKCMVLLLEPNGICNTGNAGGTLTDDRKVWI